MTFVPVNPPLRVIPVFGRAGPDTSIPAIGPSDQYRYSPYPLYPYDTPVSENRGLAPSDEFANNGQLQRDLGVMFQLGRDAATDSRCLAGRTIGYSRNSGGIDMRNYRR